MIEFDGTRVWIRTDKKGKRIYLGKVARGFLYVTDKHNYHSLSNSIGLDIEILKSHFLDYTTILFKRPEGAIVINREWFWRNGIEYDIGNGRRMIFVERRKIDIHRQLEYEKELNKSIQYQLRLK